MSELRHDRFYCNPDTYQLFNPDGDITILDNFNIERASRYCIFTILLKIANPIFPRMSLKIAINIWERP
jgi:hypothetical protein